MNKKILVLGATGFVGQAVTRQLLADGFSVCTLTRSPEKAANLFGSKIEVIPGSFEDPAALAQALEGCYAVNLSVPWQFEHNLVQQVTAILKRENRRQMQVSYISGTTVRPENRGYAMVDQKLEAEETLMKSGVTYTILKPNWFMDALEFFVRDGRATLFGRQHQPYHFIALADYARAVSLVHQSDAARNRSIVLHGPQALTMLTALQQYCAARHPGVKAASMPIWAGRLLASLGKSPELRDFVEMMAYFDHSPQVSQPDPTGLPGSLRFMSLSEWLAR